MIRVELSATDVSHLLLAENFLDSKGIYLIENMRYQETDSHFKTDGGTREGKLGIIDALSIDTNRYMQQGSLELHPTVSALNSSSNFSVDSMQLQLTSGEDAPHSDEWDNLSLASRDLDDMSIGNLFMTSGLTSPSTSPAVPADSACSDSDSGEKKQKQKEKEKEKQKQSAGGAARPDSPAIQVGGHHISI